MPLSSNNLVESLWHKAKPRQFELLLGRLLGEMGFSDVRVVGRSGDRGVDLNAVWTQSQVPGLIIDLQFVIQAKRTRPSAAINPKYIRELRGAMESGEWGLLITTGKVSENAGRSGLDDPSRVISVIDGMKLAELCRNYKVGVREHYEVDLGSFEAEPVAAPQELGKELRTEDALSRAFKETFVRIGNTVIFKSSKTMFLARWSQYYEEKSSNYWYGVTPRDLERLKEYNVKKFAFVCDNEGVVLIDADLLKQKIESGALWTSPAQGPDVRHYHILFKVTHGKIYWQLKGDMVDLTEHYHSLKIGKLQLSS